MFGTLVVWYLFLGGGGAGAEVLLAAADLAHLRERRGRRLGACGRPSWTDDLSPSLLARGHVVAAAMLAAGVACLLAELGRPERFYYVFLQARPSVLVFGSVVLAATLACAVALAAVGLFQPARVPHAAIHALEVAGLSCGLATTVYTGALLAQMHAAVPLWNAALAALFCASSLSVGTTVILATFTPIEERPHELLRVLARTDAVCVAFETVALLAWLTLAYLQTGPDTLAACVASPMLACALVLGFVLPGLVLPPVLEVIWARNRSRAALGAVVPLVLVGGFFLRWFVVNAPLV